MIAKMLCGEEAASEDVGVIIPLKPRMPPSIEEKGIIGSMPMAPKAENGSCMKGEACWC